MDLIHRLILSELFIQAIILIILIGILLEEYFNSYRKEKKGIISLLTLTILWSIYISISTFEILSEEILNFWRLFAIIDLVILFIIFIWIVVKLFNFFNKSLFLIEVILVALTIFIAILNIFYSNNLSIFLKEIISFLATLGGYFLVINFLINTSKMKK